MMAKQTMIFVDVPKPLSMIEAGTVSSITFGATEINIPEKNPMKNLNTKISQKFYIILAKAIPIHTKLENIIKHRRPFCIATPPKRDPTAIPNIAAVLR